MFCWIGVQMFTPEYCPGIVINGRQNQRTTQEAAKDKTDDYLFPTRYPISVVPASEATTCQTFDSYFTLEDAMQVKVSILSRPVLFAKNAA